LALVEFKGKSLEKLVDVVSKGIGTIYEPRKIRKNADAEAYRSEVLAKAEATKMLIENDANFEVLERTKNRIIHQEVNRQVNIEEVVEKSIPHLKENVTNEEIDEDWRTKFFQKAQDISNENIQEIWAKILANEVSKPGEISIRTMEVLSNLNKIEATKFQNLCSLVSNNDIIWKLKNQDSLDKYNFTFNDLILLRDAGLIYTSDNLVSIIKIVPKLKAGIINIGNNIYLITDIKNKKQEFRFKQLTLTVAGKELCKILNVEKNKEYFTEFINEKTEEGYEIITIEQYIKTLDKQV
jgi:uncharacterized repeat protein (TIGR03899 family)